MKRFEASTHPSMYWAIALTVVLVFAIDLQTRIGVATWILYVIPLVLCFRVTQAWLPFVVSAVCTVLVAIDWFASPAGISGQIAQVNRGMGLIVMWVAAIMAYNNIRLRHRLRRDDWIRGARARIGEAILGEQSLARLSERVLNVLMEYIDAQAGAMYVADANGTYARVGALGLPADSNVPASIKPGEGLLGRAVSTRKPIRIDDLPPDYLRIGSGLGGRAPHTLLIAPLNIDDSAHGVIELGFLHPTLMRTSSFWRPSASRSPSPSAPACCAVSARTCCRKHSARRKNCRPSRKNCASRTKS